MSVDAELVGIFLSMSDRELDDIVKPLIAKWSDPPTPLEILEPLDMCIHGALASGFVVAALQALYASACTKAGLSHEQVAVDATWRARMVQP